MKAKRKGSQREHKSIRLLESTGYHCTRAAGSLGIFDIIAIGRQGIRLIQVKSNRPPAPLEREVLQQFDNLPTNATKEVWIWHDYAREPIIRQM